MIKDATRYQIEALEVDQGSPLLICDVDEVVVHFLRGLEEYLASRDLWLDAASFALNGNIKSRKNNEALPTQEVGPLLHEFFTEFTGKLDLIDGADRALHELAANEAQVIMLTNLPEVFKAARCENLLSHGLDFPVVSNSGPKGPAVAHLLQGHDAPVAFIDDSPSYLASVHEHCPEVPLVHFMQDERFARHVGDMSYTSLQTDNWIEAHSHISNLLRR